MGRLHFSDQREENNLADKNLKARIVNKNGTSAEWEKATSFVPKKGELILYTDLNKIKIGDGITKVNDLPFVTDNYVSKTGDTMTGALGLRVEPNAKKGVLLFGQDAENPLTALPDMPFIIGGKDGEVSDIALIANSVSVNYKNGDSVSPVVGISSVGISSRAPFKLTNNDNTPFGTLAMTDDGASLSARDGAFVKVGYKYVSVGDNAGGTSQIKGVKAPVDDTDAANKKYVDDAIPTAQIEKLSSAVAKAEPFFVEVTIVSDGNHTINKTFSEIKAAYDAGRICYLRTTNQGALAQLIGITGLDTSREAIFVCVDPSNLELTTGAFIVAEEDNSVTLTIFKSQRIIEATGLLKGSGNGTITAAVAGTDYAAADHTHDTYTATEIDAMWNAVTIS